MLLFILIFQEIAYFFNPSARILRLDDLTYSMTYTVDTTEILTKDINSTQHTRVTLQSITQYSVSDILYALIMCPYLHTYVGTLI